MSTPERSPANKPQYARAKEAAAHAEAEGQLLLNPKRGQTAA
jgi:hypothetical protein